MRRIFQVSDTFIYCVACGDSFYIKLKPRTLCNAMMWGKKCYIESIERIHRHALFPSSPARDIYC